jgi:hypothetical protein
LSRFLDRRQQERRPCERRNWTTNRFLTFTGATACRRIWCLWQNEKRVVDSEKASAYTEVRKIVKNVTIPCLAGTVVSINCCRVTDCQRLTGLFAMVNFASALIAQIDFALLPPSVPTWLGIPFGTRVR